MAKVDFVNLTKERIPSRKTEKFIGALFKKLAGNRRLKAQIGRVKGIADVTLVFVSRARGKKINYEYRGKDYATDVLSFAKDEKAQGLGELVFCLPVIKRQARQHGLSFQAELEYLVIHGVLHLIGYDHEKSQREEKIMMALQDRLFDELSLKSQRKRN